MRKKTIRSIIYVLSLSLLLSSCEFGTKGNTTFFPEGAYDRVRPLKWDGMQIGDKLSFIVVTDVHKGREWNDPGVKRCEEGLMDFIAESGASENERMAILALGDISDHGGEKYFDLTDGFFGDIHARTNAPIIYTVGNHELMDSSLDDWEAHFTEQAIYQDPDHPTETGSDARRNSYVKTLGTYSIGSTLIYNVNTAYRIFGGPQLDAIEKSLEKYGEKYRYKLFLSHVPMASKKINQSLFWFIMADQDERNEMLRIMEQNGPAFRLSGHLHEGNIMTEYSDDVKEFIFTAFHSRDVSYDRAGFWHIFELDKGTGTVTIYSYDMYKKGIGLDNYTEEGVWDRKWSVRI